MGLEVKYRAFVQRLHKVLRAGPEFACPISESLCARISDMPVLLSGGYSWGVAVVSPFCSSGLTIRSQPLQPLLLSHLPDAESNLPEGQLAIPSEQSYSYRPSTWNRGSVTMRIAGLP